jgi:hypothetical protein
MLTFAAEAISRSPSRPFLTGLSFMLRRPSTAPGEPGDFKYRIRTQIPSICKHVLTIQKSFPRSNHESILLGFSCLQLDTEEHWKPGYRDFHSKFSRKIGNYLFT